MLGHNQKMSGAQVLADMLSGYGVTHVFELLGQEDDPREIDPPRVQGRNPRAAGDPGIPPDAPRRTQLANARRGGSA